MYTYNVAADRATDRWETGVYDGNSSPHLLLASVDNYLAEKLKH